MGGLSSAATRVAARRSLADQTARFPSYTIGRTAFVANAKPLSMRYKYEINHRQTTQHPQQNSKNKQRYFGSFWHFHDPVPQNKFVNIIFI
jgi:hypothetical protein